MQKTLPFCILAVLMLAAGAVRAQDVYHPITDGCMWSVSNEKYMTVGDTVLDGKTYLKLYRQVGSQPFEFNLEDAEFFAAIRDDSAERKVYAYLPAGTWVYDQFNQLTIIDAGMEVLLYDFAVQLEESFCYYTICPTFHAAQEIFASRSETAFVVEGYENGHSHYTVYENSDSLITMSDGSTRRRILLDITWGVDYWSDVWIEGIGRLKGFNDQAGFETDTPLKMLLCYSDSNSATYQTGYDFDGSDDCFNNLGYGGDVPEYEKLNVKIYPSIVTERLHISAKELNEKTLSVHIFNIIGSCVHSETIIGTEFEKQINLEYLHRGMYTVKIESSKEHVTYKIVKL